MNLVPVLKFQAFFKVLDTGPLNGVKVNRQGCPAVFKVATAIFENKLRQTHQDCVKKPPLTRRLLMEPNHSVPQTHVCPFSLTSSFCFGCGSLPRWAAIKDTASCNTGRLEPARTELQPESKVDRRGWRAGRRNSANFDHLMLLRCVWSEPFP